jgi:membrane protein DedA with SNARE-associated domain
VRWNALGGISWATLIGMIGYLIGDSAGSALKDFGLYGVVAVVLAVGGAIVLRRRHR